MSKITTAALVIIAINLTVYTVRSFEQPAHAQITAQATGGYSCVNNLKDETCGLRVFIVNK